MSKVSCSLSVGWMAIVLAFGAQAQGTTYAVRLSDNSGAYEASLRGDQEKLLEISQTSAGGLEVTPKRFICGRFIGWTSLPRRSPSVAPYLRSPALRPIGHAQ